VAKQRNDIMRYQVTPNQDLMVVIYERVDPTGMRRTETAIVKAGALMADLRHIKDAFDATFSLGPGGYSTIQVKQAHTVIVNPPEEDGGKL
jgi:hypothetical protein